MTGLVVGKLEQKRDDFVSLSIRKSLKGYLHVSFHVSFLMLSFQSMHALRSPLVNS